MEPITAAVAAFSAVKKGIQVGKDLHDMAGDIGKLWGGIDAARGAHNQKKKGQIISVEEEALETFAIKKKAIAMENDLRNFVNLSYGPNAWNEVLHIQAQIRKQKKEAIEEAKKKQAQMIENIILGVLVVFFLGVVGAILYLILSVD